MHNHRPRRGVAVGRLPIRPLEPSPPPALYAAVSARLALYAEQQAKFDALYDVMASSSTSRSSAAAAAAAPLEAAAHGGLVRTVVRSRTKLVNQRAIRSHVPVALARLLRVAPCVKRKTTVFVAGRARRSDATRARFAAQRHRPAKRMRSALEDLATPDAFDALVERLWQRKTREEAEHQRGVGRPRKKKKRRAAPVAAVFLHRNVRVEPAAAAVAAASAASRLLPLRRPIAVVTPRPRPARPIASGSNAAVVADWLGNSRVSFVAPAPAAPAQVVAAAAMPKPKPRRRVAVQTQALAADSPPIREAAVAPTSSRAASSLPSSSAARRGLGLPRPPSSSSSSSSQRTSSTRLPAPIFPRLPPSPFPGLPARGGLLAAVARPAVFVRPRPKPRPSADEWWSRG